MSPLKKQKGAALIGVMMGLLILTLLGTTAFLNSTTELKISSQYNQSLQALYAAEAGLQQLLSVYRQNPPYFFQGKTAQEMNLPAAEPQGPNGPGTKFWIVNLRYDPQVTPTYAEVIMIGKETNQNSMARVRATIYGTQSGGASGVPPIFQTGMVTAGTLHLKNTLEIFGNLHANRGYAIDPPSIIEDLKKRQFSVTQSLDPTRSDYLSSPNIPPISEEEFQAYRSMAQQAGNQILLGHQNLTLTGDQKGLLVFVDGDLILTGNQLSGVTLVVTGSITLSGSTALPGGLALDTAFIAGRDINLKDFSEILGVFWSNGSIQTIGSGKLGGAMVCQGTIGPLDGCLFHRISQISKAFLPPTPPTYSFVIGGWSQI